VTLYLEPEITAGTRIEEAALELCAVCDRLGMMLVADFNGVKLYVTRSTRPVDLVSRYHEQKNTGVSVHQPVNEGVSCAEETNAKDA